MRSLTCLYSQGQTQAVGMQQALSQCLLVKLILAWIYSLGILNQIYFRLRSTVIPFATHFFFENLFGG